MTMKSPEGPVITFPFSSIKNTGRAKRPLGIEALSNIEEQESSVLFLGVLLFCFVLFVLEG